MRPLLTRLGRFERGAVLAIGFHKMVFPVETGPLLIRFAVLHTPGCHRFHTLFFFPPHELIYHE